ncbi:MAG TPA: hypothetical protein VG756_25915 [Pseudonocardiaceae bacterium]|jgi:hypothetical protein|nr:hypothetical protein [Pseudonocardiaceae bacterium]
MVTRRSSYASRNSLARLISGIGALFALIEVVYGLLLLFNANQTNGFFNFMRALANPLALFFPGLFNVGNHVAAVILDYGLPAVFWLVVTGFVARLVAS